MSWCPAWSKSRKPQAMLRNGVTVLDRIKSRSKCSPSPSLPPSLPPPPNQKRPKHAIFPSLVWRGGLPGWGWIFNIVLSNIDVNLRVVCIAMWMTKHEQKPWQESGKNVCLKTAILVCNARNLLGVAFHRQFSRPILRRETGQPEPNPKGYVFFFKERALRDVWQW